MSLFILPIVHDFHFSRTKVHYNSTTNTLQMSMNIFTDDLELAVRNMGNDDFKIDLQFQSQTDSLIAEYVLSKFNINHGGEALRLDWVGYECDYDITYVYIESKEFVLDTNLVFTQGLLMDVFDDQENVLDYESPNLDVSHILVEGRHIVEIEE